MQSLLCTPSSLFSLQGHLSAQSSFTGTPLAPMFHQLHAKYFPKLTHLYPHNHPVYYEASRAEESTEMGPEKLSNFPKVVQLRSRIRMQPQVPLVSQSNASL